MQYFINSKKKNIANYNFVNKEHKELNYNGNSKIGKDSNRRKLYREL